MNIQKESMLIIVDKKEAYFSELPKEILELFTIKSPVSDFSKWDGLFRFIRGNRCSTSMLHLVIEELDEMGINYKIIDRRNLTLKHKIIPQVGSSYSLEDIQYFALQKMVYKIGGLTFYGGEYNCATNFGKSYLIFGLIKSLNADTVLVLFHRKLILEQIKELLESLGEKVEIFSGNINPGVITLGMYLTVFNSKKFDIDLVIVDEAHLVIGKTYTKLLKNITKQAGYYLSGTSDDYDNFLNRMKFIEIAGKELCRISNEDLQKSGRSKKVIFEFIKYENKKYLDLKSYSEQYKMYIVNNYERNCAIVDVVLKNNSKNIIIFVREKEHGKILQTLLKENEISSAFVCSDTELKRDIVKMYNSEIKVLIATKVLREGLNIFKSDYIINAMGEKSAINLKQFIGRVLRKLQIDYDTVNLVDFEDDFKNFCIHSRIRYKIYKDEKFEEKQTN